MFRKALLISATVGAMTTTAVADGHAGPHAAAIKARQSLMTLYAFNLGVLGAMAKGDVDYSADAASAAASNLAALTSMNMAAAWPAGSDSFSVEGTRAKPDIWENFPDVASHAGALAAAAAAAAETAGNSLEALQAAMGPLGGACGACHRAYREPEG